MTITDIKTFLTALTATKAQVARMEDLAMRTMNDGSIISKKEWATMEEAQYIAQIAEDAQYFAQKAEAEQRVAQFVKDESIISKKEWAVMETVAKEEEEREAELKEQYLRIMHVSGE